MLTCRCRSSLSCAAGWFAASRVKPPKYVYIETFVFAHAEKINLLYAQAQARKGKGICAHIHPNARTQRHMCAYFSKMSPSPSAFGTRAQTHARKQSCVHACMRTMIAKHSLVTLCASIRQHVGASHNRTHTGDSMLVHSTSFRRNSTACWCIIQTDTSVACYSLVRMTLCKHIFR